MDQTKVEKCVAIKQESRSGTLLLVLLPNMLYLPPFFVQAAILSLCKMEQGFTVSLSSTTSYRPTETFTQRVLRGSIEHLVKWVHLDDKSDVTKAPLKGLCREYTVWMREEEMKACCPHLLATETTRPQQGETKDTEGGSKL